MTRNVLCRISLLAAISFALVWPAAAQHDHAAGNRQLTQQEKDFLNKAYMDNMTEIEEGKVAQQKSDNRQVQQYGEMLVTDHQNNLDALKQLAQTYHVTLPSKLDQRHEQEVKRLSSMTGPGFDRAFASKQVTDHEKTIEEFKKMAQNAKAQDLNQYISNTLPVLEKHLQGAKQLQSSPTSSNDANSDTETARRKPTGDTEPDKQ